MNKIGTPLKKIFIIITIAVQIACFPITTMATDAAPTTNETTPTTTTTAPTPEAPQPTESTTSAPTQATPPEAPTPVAATPSTGPTKPTGADSTQYVKNDTTGMWESEKYIWDPATNTTIPKTPTQYTYNKTSGMWETTEWRFDAPTGTYKPVVVAKSVNPPAGMTSLAGPDSNNGNFNNTSNSADLNSTNNSTVTNRLNACATSGDASVLKNTNGGSATTGSAYTMANILNMLGSSWGGLGSTVNTFTTDINGDVTGDLYVNPGASGPGSTQTSSSTQNNNLNVNAKNTGSISNDVTLCANSGKATVNSNTNGGDATSGTADAVVNLMNMINSSILAGDSFVGVMNINGNLNGDILLPDYLRIDNLIAANTGPDATIGGTEIENSEVLASMLSNTNVDNNIQTTATSGKATVAKNNTAGSASTGGAQTNVTLLNLTGRDIVGNNGLLVFVNVLGTWVGFIVDAPIGSTTAALGGGVSSNTKNTTANLTAATNNGITNNVKVASASGDAEVSENTRAGDAKTGDASASANVLNLVNSKLSLKDWFGVLFINVFGSWHGSFGVDTANGNIAALQTVAQTGSVPVQEAQVFKFVPTAQKKARLQNVTASYANPQEPQPYPDAILASANLPYGTSSSSSTQSPSSAAENQQSKDKLINALNFGGIATLSYLGIDQLSRFSRKNRSPKRLK